MINTIKIKVLRIAANANKKRRERHLSHLNEEQKFVYNIARKLLSNPKSVLESSPRTGLFYVKNELKMVKFDIASIHFINGKYSYYFSYDNFLMEELKSIFYRHKEVLINHLVEEISVETKSHLQKIYDELTKKQ